jgi:hypothetical protein
MKYENNTVADATVYLPLDTKKNAQTFLELVHPDMVFSSSMNIELFKRTKHAKYTYLFNIRIFREQQMFLNGTAVLQKSIRYFYLLLCRTKDPKNCYSN